VAAEPIAPSSFSFLVTKFEDDFWFGLYSGVCEQMVATVPLP
jgi:hypothetical protein